LPSGVITTLARSIFRIGVINNYLTPERLLGECKAKMLSCDFMEADAKMKLLEVTQHELMKHGGCILKSTSLPGPSLLFERP
jgi:hypothetical protein